MKFIEKHWLWIVGFGVLAFVPFKTSDAETDSFIGRLQSRSTDPSTFLFPWQ